MKNVIDYVVVAILTGFGLLTIFLSTSVIFDLFDVRAKEGNENKTIGAMVFRIALTLGFTLFAY